MKTSTKYSLRSFTPADFEIEQFVDFGISHKSSFDYIITPVALEELELLMRIPHKGEIMCWTVSEGSEIRGRIAAMVNPEMTLENGKLGLLGFFDVVEDREVAFMLFDAGIQWLRTKDCDRCWAPVNYSIWHSYRFAVDHFEEEPFVGEPKNPNWYPRFAEEYGFEVLKTWDSWWVNRKGIRELMNSTAHEYDLFRRAGYSQESFDVRTQREYLNTVYRLSMPSFAHFTGFYPLSQEEFEHIFKPVTPLIDMNCTVFIKSPEKAYIGYVVCLKDKGNALVKMKGKRDLLAQLKYLWYGRHKGYANVSHGVMLSTAREQAIARCQQTLGESMAPMKASSHKVYQQILEAGYKGLLFALMVEDSRSKTFISDHVEKKRSYKLYHKAL